MSCLEGKQGLTGWTENNRETHGALRVTVLKTEVQNIKNCVLWRTCMMISPMVNLNSTRVSSTSFENLTFEILRFRPSNTASKESATKIATWKDCQKMNKQLCVSNGYNETWGPFSIFLKTSWKCKHPLNTFLTGRKTIFKNHYRA